MTNDKIDTLIERLDIMHYDISKLEARMDAVENELRLMAHEQGPQLIEIRQELVQMKKAVDTFSELTEGGTPIEALQPPPRR